MEKNIVLTIVIMGLIIFAGIQTIELANIKARLGGATISAGSAYQTQAQAPAQQQARPAPAQSAMVGGC